MSQVIGLTGSIGGGKSTVVEIFRKHGAIVADCDKIVHELYKGKALPLVAAEFPNCIVDGQINRSLLGKEIFASEERRHKLEDIIHPLVEEYAATVIAENKGKIVVLEIQKLFESGADKKPGYAITHTVVVDAPVEQRKARALASRPHLTPESFDKIDANQMPREEKITRADFVIDNSDGNDAEQQVKQILERVRANGQVKCK